MNASLAAVKGIAGVTGNSYALVADAIESLLDIFQGLVVLSGLTIAASGPDENHPYGHGKAEPLAASMAALGLIGAALGLGYESLRQIMAPDHPAPAPYTLAVLVGVIFVKEVLFRFVSRVGNEVESTAVQTDAWHHRSDALTSAFAFVGISVAVLAGPGWETADDWAALLACMLITWNGYRLLMPALGEVMDTAPNPEIDRKLRALIRGVEGVVDVDQCLVRKMGFDLYVDLHILVNANISVREGHDIAHQVKDTVRAEDPRVRDVLIHVEPDDMPHLAINQGKREG